MKQQPLLKAFVHAFNGLIHFFANDRNGRIHLAVAVWVTVAGIYFNIAVMEWMILLLCIALVIGMEMLNHALENICDAVQTTHHPLIKTAKDVGAAAVLCSAIASAIIGLLLFVPKISAMF